MITQFPLLVTVHGDAEAVQVFSVAAAEVFRVFGQSVADAWGGGSCLSATNTHETYWTYFRSAAARACYARKMKKAVEKVRSTDTTSAFGVTYYPAGVETTGPKRLWNASRRLGDSLKAHMPKFFARATL